MDNKNIEFLRKKDFQLIKELGRGGFGKAVLLYDEIIKSYFVCKKYEPYDEIHKVQFFENFVEEIRLLHLMYHQNIVRVYNYYMYPERTTGYIMMEYVQGVNIEEYLTKVPENVNEIFIQIIEGFSYLEKNGILHRDIRNQNIIVTELGVVKIIDFGFGKKINDEKHFDKSVSLNWWCKVPQEFESKIYNFKTEIYFIGKLFEKILLEKGIECFKFTEVLRKMCNYDAEKRIDSFFAVKSEIHTDQFQEIEFENYEIDSYRDFSSALSESISSIERGVKYFDDIEYIQSKIEEKYKKVMLEQYLPNNSSLIGCFLMGSYKYLPKKIINKLLNESVYPHQINDYILLRIPHWLNQTNKKYLCIDKKDEHNTKSEKLFLFIRTKSR